MSKYIISTQKTNKTIKKIDIKDGYSFNPKNKTGKYLSINDLVLYDPEQIQRILMKKFLMRYKKLVYVVNAVADSDESSDSDFMICLDEVEKLESILINKYQKHLNAKLYAYFLDNLIKTGKYLEMKFIQNRMFKDDGMFKEEGMSR